MLAEGKSAEEIAKIMEDRDREQREKEEKFRKEKAEAERKALLEQKIAEGEKLYQNGVITKEELDKIKQSYFDEFSTNDQAEGQNVNVVISQGQSLVSDEPANDEGINNNQNDNKEVVQGSSDNQASEETLKEEEKKEEQKNKNKKDNKGG